MPGGQSCYSGSCSYRFGVMCRHFGGSGIFAGRALADCVGRVGRKKYRFSRNSPNRLEMTWNMPILNILVVRQNLRDPSLRGLSWDIEKSGCFWGKFVPVFKRISKRVLNVARRPILLFRQLQLSIWSNVSSFWGFWDFRRTRTGRLQLVLFGIPQLPI